MKYNSHLGEFDTFYSENKRLLYKVCQRYYARGKALGHDREDIESFATIGFMKAYERFDPAYGTMFSTYAVPMIVGEILRNLRDVGNGGIRYGRNIVKVATQIDRQNLSDLSAEQIAEKLDISVEHARNGLGMHRHVSVASMDDVVFEAKGNEPITLGEQIAIDEDYTTALVEDFINQLPEREGKLVRLVMDKKMNQRQIGDALGISQVQVSRLIKAIQPLLLDYMQGRKMRRIKRGYYDKDLLKEFDDLAI